MADGLSCRVPNPEAVDLINREVDHVVTVQDSAIMEAMRIYFSATHNVAKVPRLHPWPRSFRNKRSSVANESL
jgi:hypothetical protein